MQPSESDLLKRYRKKGAISSRISVIIKGGRGFNSHDFKLTDVKTERISESIMGWKPSKADVVGVNVGGGASAVEARRRSVLAVSMSRKSLAENAGSPRDETVDQEDPRWRTTGALDSWRYVIPTVPSRQPLCGGRVDEECVAG